MPNNHSKRVKATKLLLGLTLLLLLGNIWVALRLHQVQHANYQACLNGNVQRADMRLLLLKHGYVKLADNRALDDRPCAAIYKRGLRP